VNSVPPRTSRKTIVGHGRRPRGLRRARPRRTSQPTDRDPLPRPQLELAVDVEDVKRANLREYQEKLRQAVLDASVIAERERRRLATALHDGIGQTLLLVKMRLAALREMTQGPEAGELGGILDLVSGCIGDQRNLIFDLSPPPPYDLGVREAVEWLTEDTERRTRLRTEVDDDGWRSTTSPRRSCTVPSASC